MPSLRRAFALLAIALVAAPLIAAAPLFDPDEGLHAAIAQEMIERGDYVTPTFLGEPFLDKPILFFWAEAASLRLFGHHEAAVRIPPLLFGVFGMIAVAALGRALFGEAAGLMSGIAYGTMLLPLGVSEVAVHDVGLVGFLCVACWCMLKVASAPNDVASAATDVASAFTRKTILLAALAGVCLGLSILTKGLVGVVFTGIFAACLAVWRPASTWRLAAALTFAGIIALLVAAPWYVAMERAHPGYLHYYFVERHLQGYLTATQRHAGRPFWYYGPILLGGALPWTPYLFLASTAARQHAPRLVVWSWLAVGLVFLSAGESKLVTYALPLFPALALIVGEYLARQLRSGRLEGKGAQTGLVFHALALAVIPQVGLLLIRQRFGTVHPGVTVAVDVIGLLTIAAGILALRSRTDRRFAAALAAMSICALAGMMLVAPRAADSMTSRDLAAALNRGGTLPSRVSVLDERIGSLVFYLDPALRAEATRDRVQDVSFAEAIARARVDPDDAVVAVRARQLPRFSRLFTTPPSPDARAGTFAIFRAATLRRALGER
jgi:4-amino-4-deoxy-L-arabinose transferase-like glycosyltransferase